MAARNGIRLVVVAMLVVLMSSGCDKDDGEINALNPDGGVDLVVSKVVDLNGNRTPAEGAVIRYVITVRNAGDWDAGSVAIRDSLPAQVKFVAADAEQGSYSPDDHLWQVGVIPPETSLDLVITVTVADSTQGWVVANTAGVVAMAPRDAVPADNHATALFTVLNGPPLAGDDAYVCVEGDSLVVASPGILANDTDLENDLFELQLEPANAPWHGDLLLAVDGSFVYRHGGGEAAVDSFTYVIVDVNAEPDTGMVRLAIELINDPPVAVNDLFSVDEGTTLIDSVLDNDTDAEGDVLTVNLAVGPSFAAAFELRQDGGFTYTHDGNEYPVDSFAYYLDDGSDQSNTATVNLTIGFTNDPPVVAGIPDQNTEEGSSFAVIALDNYVDDPDHEDTTLSWTASGAVDLVVTIDPDLRMANVTTPDAEWSGSEIITFTAADPLGSTGQDEAIFIVRPVNDPPFIRSIAALEIDEGDEFPVLMLDDVVSDPDDEDAELEWTWLGGEPLGVTMDIGRRLHVTAPDSDWFGQSVLTLHVEDPDGLMDDRSVSFIVNPVNDPPEASSLPNQEVELGSPFLPIMLDNYVTDIDDEDEDMFWTFTGNTYLMVLMSDQRIATVQAPPGWTGTETITFTVTDPGNGTDTTSARFTVTEGF